mmetsp:Transcript_65674/g.150554  ORF Transcript_65674/g.150554 Transcript_65674/m.150554 type:complete len:264 (-) Transcript_65674:448-1239(-)
MPKCVRSGWADAEEKQSGTREDAGTALAALAVNGDDVARLLVQKHLDARTKLIHHLESRHVVIVEGKADAPTKKRLHGIIPLRAQIYNQIPTGVLLVKILCHLFQRIPKHGLRPNCRQRHGDEARSHIHKVQFIAEVNVHQSPLVGSHGAAEGGGGCATLIVQQEDHHYETGGPNHGPGYPAYGGARQHGRRHDDNQLKNIHFLPKKAEPLPKHAQQQLQREPHQNHHIQHPDPPTGGVLGGVQVYNTGNQVTDHEQHSEKLD